MISQPIRTLLALSCLLALLAFVVSSRAPAAYAATIVVNSLEDSLTDGDGNCTLRQAILNANRGKDTSGGDCAPGTGNDIITFSVSGTITLVSALPTLKTNTTIDARVEPNPSVGDAGPMPSIVLDGTGQFSLLRVNGSLNTVTVTGITFLNGSCDTTRGGGGAITNFDILNIKASTFVNNSAENCVGGGAINNEGATLNINNVSFNDNTAGSNPGGAIYSTGNMTIKSASFTKNYAFGGGAVASELGGTLTIRNSQFTENEGYSYGGAIYNNGSALSVNNSTLVNNQTDDSGYGGGIANLNGSLNVTSITLSGNYAKRGGGIYNEGGALGVLASTFVNNEGWGGGGGIYNTNGSVNGQATDGTTVVTNSTLTENSTDGEFGGAFYTDGAGLFIVNSTMVSNECSDCGFGAATIYGQASAPITVKNSILAPFGTANCDVDSTSFFVFGTNYDTDGTCPGTTVVTEVALDLGPLANNGGPTQTIKPEPGSIAVNAGELSICMAPVGASEYGAGGKDQRGVKRPQEPDCDVGAVENRVNE